MNSKSGNGHGAARLRNLWFSGRIPLGNFWVQTIKTYSEIALGFWPGRTGRW